MKKLAIVVVVLSIIGMLAVSGCIGQNSATSNNTSSTQRHGEISQNTSDPQSEYYDQMNDSFSEIDYLGNLSE